MVKKWYSILAIALAAIIVLAGCINMPSSAQDTGRTKDDNVSIIGHAKCGSSDYDIIKFDWSDALYIREYAVGINGMGIAVLVPFLDGDGSPVTLQEYQEREG